MALSEVGSDGRRWPALLGNVREGPSGPSQPLQSPLLSTGGLRLEIRKSASSEPRVAKVKVQQHIHQRPVTRGRWKNDGGFQRWERGYLQTVLLLNGKDIAKYGLQNAK